MSTTSNLTTAQLCSGTPTVSVIDNRGLFIRTLQYNRNAVGEAADERVTQQQYNVIGQLMSSLDPRLYSAQQSDPAVLANFRYQNSLSGKVLQSQSQDAGRHVTLHDVEGGPVWQENSRGFLKRMSYDNLHRVSVVFEQDGATANERVSERYVYGELAERFDTYGRLIRHYDTAGLNEVLHYTYRGQPLQTVRRLLLDEAAQSNWPADEIQSSAWLESERYQSSLTYNALDEVLSTIDAQGNQQHRYLDVASQLLCSGLTLTGQSEERTVLASITYSAGGQVLREVSGNGVVSTSTYEPQTLRLSRLVTTRPAQDGRSTLLQDFSYTYDPVGNILSISDAAINTSYYNNQQIEPNNTYQYDALYQLCSASGRENAGASRQGPDLPVASTTDPNQYGNYTRQYEYDRGGNLIQVRHVGNSNYTLDMQVSSTSNRTVRQKEFLTSADVEGQFDTAGNLKQLVEGQPMLWDGRNQLQRVTQIQRSGPDDDEEHYQYDGGGARVRKTTVSQTSGTTRRAQVIYLPGLELRRTQSTQGPTRSTEEELHVLSLGSAGRQQMRVLHWVTGQPADIPNDQLRGSLDNQIGSSLLELDQHADVLTQEEYYPFGGTAVWSGKNASEIKYKFVRYSGKERDATGLYYYGFRYYAPWLGRWINPDPGGTVDGLNLYRMVRNNPITLFDVDGLAPGDDDEPVITMSIAARRRLFESASASPPSTRGESSERPAPTLATKPSVATKPVVSTPFLTVPSRPNPAATNLPLHISAVASNRRQSPIVLPTAEQTVLPSYAASSLAVGSHQLMLTSSGSVVAMRGDDRSPEQIRAAGGFFPRDNRGLKIKQEFRQAVVAKGVNTQAQEHVRSPVGGYVATGMDEDSGGYGNSRAYLYRMEIPGLREQAINAQTLGLGSPFEFTPKGRLDTRLLMSGDTLDQSEFVAMIPPVSAEMTFITPIPDAYIVASRATGSDQWKSFH